MADESSEANLNRRLPFEGAAAPWVLAGEDGRQ